MSNDDIPANTPLSRLFVYGTLMSTAASAYGRDMRIRLGAATTHRQAATLRGRLYELGQYPGLIDSDNSADLVHGELLVLAAPVETLAWLDDYEAISPDRPPDRPDDNEYARVVRQVRLGSGISATAWVYVYQRPVAGLVRVASGRWGAAG